ncbi:cysteine--tRNA ligase 2, cytoplasmic-like [Macadamia integrifolia]|uniref:cysteine--tRNA ligase 2, cytoplasmic-like n=1 Tax=Macadamia integrifolia TaxID=60698 RepID=UPI001C4EEE9C|nr:cysteine--tRNA ligase 2, cytoplasmic-like [Macadamia integrifolia]
MENQEFQVYNTMTKQKEIFKPIEPGKVGMYVCGITAYDYSHIGHARAYVAFDVLYRYLKYLGYEVNYVRNFTDVDDKIIRRANELGEDPISLSGRFCEEFLADMDDLGCLRPTQEPPVSKHMDQIRAMIAQLIEKDFAYPVDGDVYFAVDNFPDYGRLSGRKLEDNRAGERVAVDSRKKNPADFALWKATKPGEPSWVSPWGPGRPGWHIECSAMSAHYLTASFDIHGGGMDLIFPHHENEIAQSCGACSSSKVGYWMHNGFVTQNDEKMSKSLGNFFTIREVTKQYHPMALRYFLMSTHYRSPVNYSIAQLDNASFEVLTLYRALHNCEVALSPYREGNPTDVAAHNGQTVRITPDARKCIDKLHSDFESKMADDLHVVEILNGALKDSLTFINSSLGLLKKKQKQQQKQPSPIQSLVEVEKEVKKILVDLGLLSSSTCSEVLQQLKEKALVRAGMKEEDVLLMIEERTKARKEKDFERSDQIRGLLYAKGIYPEDEGAVTTWWPCVPPEDPKST